MTQVTPGQRLIFQLISAQGLPKTLNILMKRLSFSFANISKLLARMENTRGWSFILPIRCRLTAILIQIFPDYMVKRITRIQSLFGQELDTLLYFPTSLLCGYLICILKFHSPHAMLSIWPYLSQRNIFSSQTFLHGCYQSIGSWPREIEVQNQVKGIWWQLLCLTGS